jgi:hypothetical protein
MYDNLRDDVPDFTQLDPSEYFAVVPNKIIPVLSPFYGSEALQHFKANTVSANILPGMRDQLGQNCIREIKRYAERAHIMAFIVPLLQGGEILKLIDTVDEYNRVYMRRAIVRNLVISPTYR